MQTRTKSSGFTLLEILIALFIFTVISMIMVAALRNITNLQSGSEIKAAKLRKLQVAFLIMARDVEQTVNRPVLNASSKEDPAFIGTTTSMTFTRAGYSGLMQAKSSLQRVRYLWDNNRLSRITWPVLDVTAETKPLSRTIYTDAAQVRFEYLDKDNRARSIWPMANNTNDQPLPRAVRVYLSIPKWGEISQLFLIIANVNPPEATNVTPLSNPPTPAPPPTT